MIQLHKWERIYKCIGLHSVRSENLKIGMLVCFSAELFRQLPEVPVLESTAFNLHSNDSYILAIFVPTVVQQRNWWYSGCQGEYNIY